MCLVGLLELVLVTRMGCFSAKKSAEGRGVQGLMATSGLERLCPRD